MAPARPRRQSLARAGVLAERARVQRRSAAARCVAQGEQHFEQFCQLLKHECFDADGCGEHVKQVQLGALEPWYQHTGPDGSKLAPWPRVLGIRRSAREGTWFSEAVESGFASSYPAGRRGFYTGAPGDVSADVWLLRAWCRARGGVARMGDALAARLQQLEGDRDIMYRVEAAEGARGRRSHGQRHGRPAAAPRRRA